MVQPYYVNPSCRERGTADPPVVGPLRGDFFCLSFGADNRVEDEHHLPHGESSYGDWQLVAPEKHSADSEATFQLHYAATRGRFVKRIICTRQHPTIYVEHRLDVLAGAFPVSHHAIPTGDLPDESWKTSTGSFEIGMTDPSYRELAAGGEYYALRAGTEFNKLERVETRWRDAPITNCSLFPIRASFIDLYPIYRSASKSEPLESRLGWVAAYNRSEKYLWYTRKDSAVLPATLLWVENGGRHESPWDGRNSCIGIEETCSYFASGRAPSIKPNVISERGIPTAIELKPDDPTFVRTIQGVVEADWGGTDSIRSLGCISGSVAFMTSGGNRISLPVEARFLETGHVSATV